MSLKELWRDFIKGQYYNLFYQEINNSIQTISQYKTEIRELDVLLTELNKEINSLKLEIVSLKKPKDELKEYWDNKWSKNKVIYKAQGNIKRDVRNLILTKSYILQPIADKFKDQTNDKKALNILRYVKTNLSYISDITTHKVPEFWQNPEETWQTKKGDCEDGALLIASLMRMAGVPSYRIKLCAGFVIQNNKKIGHAYVIYLSEKNNEWYTLDWCFYYLESVKAFNKTLHKDMSNYQGIWWTANDEFTWAQRSTIIN